jgi:predicted NBD/HSP70 family sugar kinase
VPFGQEIGRRLGTRVLIENDANLVALAEHGFGFGHGLATFMVVTIENVIGMGLVLNGRLHRGAHGMGPEFGHVKAASNWGILQQALASDAIEPAEDGAGPRQLVELTRRAQAGNNALAGLFRRAGEVLGLAIANAVNLLNPPCLVITGEGLHAGDLLRVPLLAAIRANVLPTLQEATQIVFHPWGDEMWARGAVTIVLRQIYEAPWNNAA